MMLLKSGDKSDRSHEISTRDFVPNSFQYSKDDDDK